MPVPTSSAVAVIDIGSNSIKLLVASRNAQGELVILKSQTEETRIGAGISQAKPFLSKESMARGRESIRKLLSEAEPFAPAKIALVATSAVRDAANGQEFRDCIRAAMGHTVQILTGEEEANLIGKGLTEDPALADLQDFYLFDLGGGSLECLSFRARKVEQSLSLQLGCVRLTERCLPHPDQPMSREAQTAISRLTQDTLSASAFRFSLPPGSPAVGTGGTVTALRILEGADLGKKWTDTSPIVPVDAIKSAFAKTASLDLAARKQIPGMPASRADVLPTALLTLITLAELGHFNGYRHSMYNLRYGLASELLG